MCSELTPRAPNLDSRIAQFMQPCHDDDDLGAESIGQPTTSAGPSSISTTWKPEKVKLVDFEFI